MRIFILPSWCPTRSEPLAGSFFIEQAHSLATHRPSWQVAICTFDLYGSRFRRRPDHAVRFLVQAIASPRLRYRCIDGLHTYRVWRPHFPPTDKAYEQASLVDALVRQVRPAVLDYSQRFGRPDLIHAHAAHPGGSAAVRIGRELAIPVMLTEHMGPFPPPAYQTRDGRPIQPILDAYAGTHRVAAVSTSLASRIRSMGLAQEIDVIPNALAVSFIGLRQLEAPPRVPFRFLTVAWPSHAKGTDTLLHAMADLDDTSMLTVVGDGPERRGLEMLGRDLGLGERVHWIGNVPRNRMIDHYQACHVFVLPSRGETFGVSLVEALACGKPLIATRCGGPEDIVTPSCGLLVPIDDPAGLASAMRVMKVGIDGYPSASLRQDALSRFSSLAVVDQIEAWYRNGVRQSK